MAAGTRKAIPLAVGNGCHSARPKHIKPASCADLDLGFLGPTGQRQQVEERDADQQEDAGFSPVGDELRLEPEADQHHGHRGQRQRQADAEAHPAILDQANEREADAEDHAADQGGRQQPRFRNSFGNEQRREGSAGEDAEVRQRRGFRESETERGCQPALDPVTLASRAHGSDAEPGREAAEHGQEQRLDIALARLLQSNEQEQAEEEALGDVFELQPCRMMSRRWCEGCGTRLGYRVLRRLRRGEWPSGWGLPAARFGHTHR